MPQRSAPNRFLLVLTPLLVAGPVNLAAYLWHELGTLGQPGPFETGIEVWQDIVLITFLPVVAVGVATAVALAKSKRIGLARTYGLLAGMSLGVGLLYGSIYLDGGWLWKWEQLPTPMCSASR